MEFIHQDLCEIHLLGRRTQEWRLDVGTCAQLAESQIAWLGWSLAASGYRFERASPPFSGIVACEAGSGLVRIGSRWHRCDAGTVCLLPPAVPHAYHAVGKSKWRIGWIAFHQPSGQLPFIRENQPRLIKADVGDFLQGIRGLHREWRTFADPESLRAWIALIRISARRFTRAPAGDPRLFDLWSQVNQHPEKPWTLALLAECAGIGPEQLRRLCRRHQGHSPMHHATLLRMQAAAALLASTSLKVESIAAAMGYSDPFAFSTTFRRLIGVAPTVYRRGRIDQHDNARQ